MNRLTTNKKLNPEIFKNIKDMPENKYFLKVPNGKTFDDTIELIADKLGQLEDIEEEIGFEKSGSSLLAFLQTPYIKSIMKLYVSARKELEND